MTPTTTAAPDATPTPTVKPKAKKSKKHQISRSPEARKARRIIRQSLRYSMTTAVEDPEVTAEEKTEAAEWLEENAELIDESLDFMASIRRERKATTEKKAKTRKAERKRVVQEELAVEQDEDDADDEE